MKLSQAINQYVTSKQSMGMLFETEARILRSFCRMVGDVNVTQVEHDSALAFISGNGPVTTYWHQKFKILNGFYRFAISRGYADSSPLPARLPKRPEPLVPYIYTQEELRRLLAATDILKTRKSPLQAATFRTLLLTLYGTCLRISEALSLTLADVDISDSLIIVRQTKFYKSRFVPIGPQLTKVLDIYASKRRQLPAPAGKDSAFFATRTGSGLTGDRSRRVFGMLRKQAGIHRENRCRYQPRIHDIRHTSAVHRVVSWYRGGADVQRLLLQLGTYMGHKDVGSTQRYLSMIPELLGEALLRFEGYALSEVSHE